MVRVKKLSSDIQAILEKMRPWIESKSKMEWKRGDPLLPMVVNGIVRRQFEILETIVHLADVDRGYASAPLLRPSCEERIWCRYLGKIDREVAELLLQHMASIELFKNLDEQEQFAGPDVMKALGLTEHLQQSKKRKPANEEFMKLIGKRLNWPKGTVAAAKVPDMWFLAQETGLIKDYKFLYHGTSRFVHFKVSEILRRSWGSGGKASIDSHQFADYWASFSLCWGFMLFLETINEAYPNEDVFSEQDASSVKEIHRRVLDFGFVPLITAEELAWEDG